MGSTEFCRLKSDAFGVIRESFWLEQHPVGPDWPTARKSDLALLGESKAIVQPGASIDEELHGTISTMPQ